MNPVLFAEIEREVGQNAVTAAVTAKGAAVIPGSMASAAGVGTAKAAAAGLAGHTAPYGMVLGSAAIIPCCTQASAGAMPLLMAKGFGLGMGVMPGWPLVIGAGCALTISALYDRYMKTSEGKSVPEASFASEAMGYINDKVQTALSGAEIYRNAISPKVQSTYPRERRYSFRVKVPDGAMAVVWKNKNGQHCSANAIDISFRGIHFDGKHYDAKDIDRLEFPRLGINLDVTKSSIVRRDGDSVVVYLKNFSNDVDGWMSWIEILTRIDQE